MNRPDHQVCPIAPRVLRALSPPSTASGRVGSAGNQRRGRELPWSLVTDYTNGVPNGGYAQTYHDHLAGF